MIRVLVAEDSPTARSLLVSVLAADPEITVVGEARDGVEAVELAGTLRPDLVTMDIHMPRLDGLAATKEIMIVSPTPIVIVTGSQQVQEVGASLETLRVGALEVLEKLPNPASPAFEAAARRMIAVVKAMSQVKVVRHWRTSWSPSPPTSALSTIAPGSARGKVVAIASSTGGPAALQRLLSGLPRSFPVPILVVQHITPGFTSGLAAWLGNVCHFRVRVAEEGDSLVARTVYLAPDGRHLGVSGRHTAVLSASPPIGGFRPSATALFESVAQAYGASAVAVILTGMGEDGVVGLRAIRKAGGRILAQDEGTSVVFGMPGAAVDAGLAHAVLPLDSIAPRLLSMV